MMQFIILVAVLLVIAYVGYRYFPNYRKPYFESYIEERLYYALIAKGYIVRTQARCGPFRVDLALPKYRIAIECDGKDFHSSPDQKKRDKKRSAYLYKNGYRSVLRFTGSEIVKDPYGCVKKIEKKIGKVV
jgi:very-short-patch-repair endonuclease